MPENNNPKITFPKKQSYDDNCVCGTGKWCTECLGDYDDFIS